MGSLPVEFVEITISVLPESNAQKSIVKWDLNKVQEQLPIVSGSSATLLLNLFGDSNFLFHASTAIGNEMFLEKLIASFPEKKKEKEISNVSFLSRNRKFEK